jgi:hypothetical protein
VRTRCRELEGPTLKLAAVYWETRRRECRVMAIDRYTTVADNVPAIAATLDAMRAFECHANT